MMIIQNKNNRNIQKFKKLSLQQSQNKINSTKYKPQINQTSVTSKISMSVSNNNLNINSKNLKKVEHMGLNRQLKPLKPLQSIQPLKPLKPPQSIQPIKPVQPIQPLKSLRPLQPLQPLQPLKPLQSLQPLQPLRPLQQNNVSNLDQNYLNNNNMMGKTYLQTSLELNLNNNTSTVLKPNQKIQPLAPLKKIKPLKSFSEQRPNESSRIFNIESNFQSNNQSYSTNNNNNLPNYGIDYVYGYNGSKRNSCYFNYQGNIVFFASTIGVVLNPNTKTQNFFAGHTQSIIAMAIHPNKRIVATGQINDPTICIWDSSNCQLINTFKPSHDKGICAFSFSFGNNHLVSVGLDDEHTICLWNWQTGKLLTSQFGSKNKILCAHFDPRNNSSFVTCGIRTLMEWNITNQSTLSSTEFTFGNQKDQILLSLIITTGGDILTGTRQGLLYLWDREQKNIKKQVRNHKQACNVLCFIQANNYIISGGKEGDLLIRDSVTLEKHSIIKSINGGPITALDYLDQNKIVTGTFKNQIWTTNLSFDLSEKIFSCHHGEVLGVACHVQIPQFVTTSLDRSVRVWSIETKQQLNRLAINGQPKCVIYSPDYQNIVIGMLGGGIVIVSSQTLKTITTKKISTEEISCMVYSKDMKYFAVAFTDGKIFIFVVQSNYKRNYNYNLPNVKAIDISADSNFFRASTGTVTKCWKIITHHEVDPENIQWETENVKLASLPNEIFEVDTNKDLIAKPDYRNNNIQIVPHYVQSGNSENNLKAHGSKVSAVKFFQNSHLISVGGDDKCIIQWKRI
ncbi:echinoderm microtubule-associated protein-like elp-1 [Anaeramoeba flamelloides]|uniref:Echinoderm microtubule-associated protein-like elp-1 n=1 Tax=Anaeramoeba flamelloides TaxID=1746091 RepID=A0AAV7ZHQ3_9EUKA|nr:echinoderm microtubule-associated protein-like elp-1 [Anaeramoeba flamelloides]